VISMAKTYTCPASNMLDGEDINFKRPSQAKEILRRLKKNRGAMIGLFLLICIILVVIFADVIASYEAGVVQIADNKLAPMSSEHPLGCDSYGRDVLSRLVHGARNSLLVAVASSISSCLFGCTLGAIAGYFGGKVDMLIMRALDIFHPRSAVHHGGRGRPGLQHPRADHRNDPGILHKLCPSGSFRRSEFGRPGVC